MKEFIKLNTDPAEVIELFPELDGKENSKNKKLKGKDLENALNALIEYLTQLRLLIGQNKLEPGTSQEQGSQRNVTQQLELIDTTLLKCYLQVCYSWKYYRIIFILYGNKLFRKPLLLKYISTAYCSHIRFLYSAFKLQTKMVVFCILLWPRYFMQ